MTLLRGILALAVVPGLGSCLSVDYARFNLYESLDGVEVEQLATRNADLAACLDRLGAPNLVFDADPGPVLAWLHGEFVGWVVEGSASVAGDVPLSLTYGRRDDQLEALVVFLDADWRVERVRGGGASDFELFRGRPRLEPAATAPR